MRGCLLDDDGNVVEYLNPRDWTGHVRDGSRGQVMVEFGTSIAVLKQAQILSGSNSLSFLFPAIVMFL